MDDNTVFKKGKHTGKTLKWVKENDPDYLAFLGSLKAKAKTEQPKPETKLLKDVVSDKPKSSMQPNMNFWNEGPDPMSIPYLEKMKENQNKNLEN